MKISVSKIVKDHFSTLVDQDSNKTSFIDIFTFLILPIFLSLFISYLGFSISSDNLDSVISSLSIFVGLLFNALVILLDVARKIKESLKGVENLSEIEYIKKNILFINEINSNISFSILLSFVVIITSILGLKEIDPCGKYCWLISVLDFVSYFFLILFFLTFLMILKRFYAVFTSIIKD